VKVHLGGYDIDGQVVKDNDTYMVMDNTSLEGLVLSKTILYPMKETSGHDHPGQEEVYQFTHGHGRMTVGPETFGVKTGDMVLIPDGAFHKVFNESKDENLAFVCVFDGKRNH
jgi:mannose-6-phosphate isomerase-like protein (cupin superfamily)